MWCIYIWYIYDMVYDTYSMVYGVWRMVYCHYDVWCMVSRNFLSICNLYYQLMWILTVEVRIKYPHSREWGFPPKFNFFFLNFHFQLWFFPTKIHIFFHDIFTVILLLFNSNLNYFNFQSLKNDLFESQIKNMYSQDQKLVFLQQIKFN